MSAKDLIKVRLSFNCVISEYFSFPACTVEFRPVLEICWSSTWIELCKNIVLIDLKITHSNVGSGFVQSRT